MRSTNQDVIAVLASDLHITDKVPVARGEKDWFEVQERYLKQVQHLCRVHDCPLVVAGDVFDRPNPSPEVINFAIQNLPRCYAVPGQHDLLYHSYKDIKKTAYWTLVWADAIIDLASGKQDYLGDGLYAIGFPWGSEVEPLGEKLDKTRSKDCLYIAVIHSYIWTKDENRHGKAEWHTNLNRWRNRLKGYDAAVFGDNHQGFIKGSDLSISICNCGTFIPRRMDEMDYKPFVGLLRRDGSIVPHYLDTEEDIWNTEDQMIEKAEALLDIEQFLSELADLEVSSLSFRDTMREVIRNKGTAGPVREIILKAMEDKK